MWYQVLEKNFCHNIPYINAHIYLIGVLVRKSVWHESFGSYVSFVNERVIPS